MAPRIINRLLVLFIFIGVEGDALLNYLILIPFRVSVGWCVRARVSVCVCVCFALLDASIFGFKLKSRFVTILFHKFCCSSV